jgi:hypothetical protein
VVDTASYSDAGGRHPDTDMESVGCLFGHRNPRGGLHLNIVNNNFSKQKILLPKQGKGVLWYTTTISDPSFSNPDPLKFVRPINQFLQTHQFH